MNTALKQLREKTDRQLAVVIRREVEQAHELTARGRYREAERRHRLVRALLAVANLTAQEKARIERMLAAPATACA